MVLIIVVSIILLLVMAIILFMQQPKFGRTPNGERLIRVKQSPHFKKDKFENISHTPDLTDGATIPKIMKEFFFAKNPNLKPKTKLPSQKIDLHNLDKTKNVLVWFGHSSYFLQVDGKRFLVDPVLSGAASPIKFTTKSFEGSDAYAADDIPEIDYLIITHDHWDHLDYETVLKLKPKIKKIITSLGVGEHLEHWKFDKGMISETHWNDETDLEHGFKVITKTARHFSGRGFKRAQALWSSFVLITPSQKIYIGGDSGYDSHFKEIGNEFGAFDLVILECGQYNKYWKHIHMMPEETVKAAIDLKAKKLLPVHWAKFSLAMHDWNDSIKRVVKAANEKNMPIVTPMIGEPLLWNDDSKSYKKWWEEVK